MKTKLIVLAVTLVLSGCGMLSSTVKKEDESKQKLSTSFTRQGIKIEWDCVHQSGLIWKTCKKTDIKSIEVTAYDVSFGATELQREKAFKVAEAKAKAKLAMFVKEDIRTTSTINTLAKNIEKAKSVSRVSSGSTEVSMTDEEARSSNINTSDSTGETAQTVAETITTSSHMILRGVRTIEEKIVDRRTVAVTIRWDQTSDNSATSLQRRFIQQ